MSITKVAYLLADTCYQARHFSVTIILSYFSKIIINVQRKTLLTTLISLLFLSFFTLAKSPIKVAIVIDDMGYRYTDEQALTLPGHITYSVLPHTTYGKLLALKASAQNNDVLLHIPMEAENGKKLGPGALTRTMNKQEVYHSLTTALKEIPFAIGINNHMGSYLTQQYQPMAWTMTFLKDHDLFFLDSKTSAKSQGVKAAKDYGVPVKSRNIFLDNQLDSQYIKQQFDHLVRYAKKKKTAIAIAHPHPETINNLKALIPTLQHNGIELVPLSQLYSSSAHSNTFANTSEE